MHKIPKNEKLNFTILCEQNIHTHIKFIQFHYYLALVLVLLNVDRAFSHVKSTVDFS